MYKLSPSDFKYLWEDCKHCFYQKVKYGVQLPSIGLPGVFSKMNSMLQETIQGMNLQSINPALPSGIIEIKEGFLKSQPIPPAGDCFISGRFDILSNLGDGTYAVIDFKITDPGDGKAQKFAPQLHAYKFALENPIAGVEPKKVSLMGLVTISPQTISFDSGQLIFRSTPQWFPIGESMTTFYAFVSEVSRLLSGPPPQTSDSCPWCKYRLCFNHPGQTQQKTASDAPTTASLYSDDLPF